MGDIRALQLADLPSVARLFRRVYPQTDHLSEKRLCANFHTIFFENPWREDSEQPSLLYVEKGQVVGFLGLLPRAMLFEGRPIRAVISSHFMVDPDLGKPLPALLLMRQLLEGGQDLYLATEANNGSRSVWEALGGEASLIGSMEWLRPLRPVGYVAYQLAKRALPARLGTAARFVGRSIDLFRSRKIRSQYPELQDLSGETLSDATLLQCLQELVRDVPLRPQYDRDSLAWLLRLLEKKKGLGTLRRILVRDAAGEILGWYIYFLAPDDVSKALQFHARPKCLGAVIHHMFEDARSQGALALSGKLVPRFVEEVADDLCFYVHSGWLLVHSRSAEIRAAVNRGEIFLTRLEGEFWSSMQGELEEPAVPA